MNDFTPITTREELDAAIAPYKEKAAKYDALISDMNGARLATLEERVETLTQRLTAASDAISENTQAIENLTIRFDIHNRHS